MRYPSQFNAMLILSHVTAAIFKTGFALIGFLTWQEQISEVITNNLPTQELRIIINLTLSLIYYYHLFNSIVDLLLLLI